MLMQCKRSHLANGNNKNSETLAIKIRSNHRVDYRLVAHWRLVVEEVVVVARREVPRGRPLRILSSFWLT